MSETSRQYWQRHIHAQRESGLNIKAYARRESLSVNMLYQWRGLLGLTRRQARSQVTQSSSPGFAQATVAVVDHALNASTSPCRLTLGPGMHLEMAALPSPQWLLALVNACREAS